MIDGVEKMAATEQELRSGLPGLGGRPKRHPAWGEFGQSAPVGTLPSNGAWRRGSVTGSNRADDDPAAS